MFDKIQTRFQYFIIFVDDYSRVTWLYLIKSLIALCKGKHTCISHPVSRFVSYSYLSPFFQDFFSSLDSYYVLKSVSEAQSILSLKNAIKKICWL